MLVPACTGFGDATFVTDRLGPVVPTIVVTVAVLLDETGSMAEEATDTVPVITVPLAVALLTFTTRVNVPDVDAGRLALLQTIFPVPPTRGLRQLHPAGDTSETKVVFVGIFATTVALSVVLGPLLVTIYV